MSFSTFDLSTTPPTPPGAERATIIRGAAGTYRSPAGLGRAAVILLTVFASLNGVAAVWWLPLGPVSVSPSTALLWLILAVFVALAKIGVFFATSIVFLMWYYRCYDNLPALGAHGVRATPGWAIAWFFIPIASMIRPFQTTLEMWRAIDPDVSLSDSESRSQRPGSGLLGWWWAAWLFTALPGRAIDSGCSIGPEIATAVAGLIYCLLAVAAAVLAIQVEGVMNYLKSEMPSQASEWRKQ